MPDQINTAYLAGLLVERDKKSKAFSHLRNEELEAEQNFAPYPPELMALRDECKYLLLCRIIQIDGIIDRFCTAFELNFYPPINEN